jgi:hypothetical protein
MEASPAHHELGLAGPELDGRAGLRALQAAAGNRAVSGLIQGALPAVMRSVTAQGGQPLEPPVRAEMEGRFGEPFDSVRVHSSSQAARSAEAVGANAYTFGRHVVFAEHRYAPDTFEGKRLLAHELAHVVQQRRGGRSPALQGDSALEADANQAAMGVSRGEPRVTVSGASDPGMALDEDKDKKPGRLDRLYSSFLQSSLVPKEAKDAVRATNDALKARIDSIEPTGGLREAIKEKVADVVGSQRLDASQKALQAKPRPAASKAEPPVKADAAAQRGASADAPKASAKPLSDEERQRISDDEKLAARGLTRQQLIDYVEMSPSDFRKKYGFFSRWGVHDKAWALANELPGVTQRVLHPVLPKVDATVYMHASGRIGTNADETAKRLEEFDPGTPTGGLVRGALYLGGASPETAEKWGKLGDTIEGALPVAGLGAGYAKQRIDARKMATGKPTSYNSSEASKPASASSVGAEALDLLPRSEGRGPINAGEMPLLTEGELPPHTSQDMGAVEPSNRPAPVRPPTPASGMDDPAFAPRFEGDSLRVPRQLSLYDILPSMRGSGRTDSRAKASWNALMKSMYKFEPKPNTTYENNGSRYSFDADGRLVQVSSDKNMAPFNRHEVMGKDNRVPSAYRDAPTLPGHDFGHVGSIETFGHNDFLLQAHGGFPQESTFNQEGEWRKAEQRVFSTALQLHEQGKPFLKVAQVRNFVNGVPTEWRAYVESEGQMAYDSGWLKASTP